MQKDQQSKNDSMFYFILSAHQLLCYHMNVKVL